MVPVVSRKKKRKIQPKLHQCAQNISQRLTTENVILFIRSVYTVDPATAGTHRGSALCNARVPTGFRAPPGALLFDNIDYIYPNFFIISLPLQDAYTFIHTKRVFEYFTITKQIIKETKSYQFRLDNFK